MRQRVVEKRMQDYRTFVERRLVRRYSACGGDTNGELPIHCAGATAPTELQVNLLVHLSSFNITEGSFLAYLYKKIPSIVEPEYVMYTELSMEYYSLETPIISWLVAFSCLTWWVF